VVDDGIPVEFAGLRIRLGGRRLLFLAGVRSGEWRETASRGECEIVWAGARYTCSFRRRWRAVAAWYWPRRPVGSTRLALEGTSP
jgi:hypothetical protein